MLILPLKIQNDSYAIGIDNIKEVIPVVEFSEIPGSPDFMKGLINYRGQVCPIIDLSSLLKNVNSKNFLSTRIIIFEITDDKVLFGLLAEQVTETVFIDFNEISRVADGLTSESYIESTIIFNNKIIRILNPQQIYFDKVKIYKNIINLNND